MKTFLFSIITASIMAFVAPLQAASLIVPNTFSAGTPAVAAEVNSNFTEVKTAVDDNDARIAALETVVAALQANLNSALNQISAINNSNVMDLDAYLTVSTIGGAKATLSGINLQIVNGIGNTDTVNGLGNLIIGYDEANANTSYERCADGAYSDQTSCESSGAIWSYSHKTGSHYLVLGGANSYSSYGGMVAGFGNFATGGYGIVTGGSRNTASGSYSSVSGGYNNTTSGYSSSVSGGGNNTASGIRSSVSGGSSNIASGSHSSVSGGYHNTASGIQSSVSSGYYNTASGGFSSVSGGYVRSVTGTYDWAAGTLFEDL